MQEKDYWIAFSTFSGIGPVTFENLLSRFSSAKAAWEAPLSDLKEILKEKKTKDFIQYRDFFDFSNYLRRLDKANVQVITLAESSYPKLLKQIDKPPFVLYVRGDLHNLTPYLMRDPQQISKERQNFVQGKQVWHDKGRTIAIVGTRKITQYGKAVTELFTRELVDAGCTIISGLAMGVDAIAHKTTIENNGKTIAVLGCGVDCCYPRENETLYDEIIAGGGAILSEVPLGMSATVGTFPARNRIVAGLSEAILVTEGAEDSGALITADFGLSYERYVFAVPGPITSSLSKGPFKLIEKGAKLVTDPKDIMRELGLSGEKRYIRNKGKITADTEEEQMIIDVLQNESLSFDEIVRYLKIDSSKLGVMLSLMEIKGVIMHNAQGRYILRS